MPITVTTPATSAPVAAKTFDVFWLSNLNVQANNPNRPIRVMATVEKVADNGDGTFTKAPEGLALAKGNILIEDLYTFAATDAVFVTLPTTLGGAGPAATLALADIISALLLKMKSLGEAQGKL